MTTFNELGLAETILRAVEAEGYTEPTPIQLKAIPAILAGRDVLGLAQTGTGKTAAFVLPILQKLKDGVGRRVPKGCRALILAPTRELAAQIADSVRTYGRFAAASCAVVVGGVRPGPQIAALARGPDIVVATPGRLLDHMGTGAFNLSSTAIVVLDEADRMLDMGFLPAIRRIVKALPSQRQTILLSATMPKEIKGLATDLLRQPDEIAIVPQTRAVELIDQKVMLVEAPAKRAALVGILSAAEVERTIVFTRTKRGADHVCTHLQASGLSAAAIHGYKSQSQRERALDAFRDGQVKILVATDIAARGIDVDGVSHVVNYEIPEVPEAYVHRIGRTGRAGAEGIAISLCASAERGLFKDIERTIGRAIARVDGPRVDANAGQARISSPAPVLGRPTAVPANASRQPNGKAGKRWSGPRGRVQGPARAA